MRSVIIMKNTLHMVRWSETWRHPNCQSSLFVLLPPWWMHGFNSSIQSASRVIRWTTLRVVAARNSVSSRLSFIPHLSKWRYTGSFLRDWCSLRRVQKCRSVWPTYHAKQRGHFSRYKTLPRSFFLTATFKLGRTLLSLRIVNTLHGACILCRARAKSSVVFPRYCTNKSVVGADSSVSCSVSVVSACCVGEVTISLIVSSMIWL